MVIRHFTEAVEAEDRRNVVQDGAQQGVRSVGVLVGVVVVELVDQAQELGDVEAALSVLSPDRLDDRLVDIQGSGHRDLYALPHCWIGVPDGHAA